MADVVLSELSKRERQILDIIYRLGEATAVQVIEGMPDKVGDDSIRKLIRILEKKGFLEHRRESHHYIYTPTVSREEASRLAMKRTVETFFQDSAPKAVAALLDITKGKLSKKDIDEISSLIDRAEEEGR